MGELSWQIKDKRSQTKRVQGEPTAALWVPLVARLSLLVFGPWLFCFFGCLTSVCLLPHARLPRSLFRRDHKHVFYKLWILFYIVKFILNENLLVVQCSIRQTDQRYTPFLSCFYFLTLLFYCNVFKQLSFQVSDKSIITQIPDLLISLSCFSRWTT